MTGLTQCGIKVEFQPEALIFAGDDSPVSTLLLTMLGAVAEFLRAQTLDNQCEGIAKARQAGKYKGRKRILDAGQVEELRPRVQAGEPMAALARELGINRQTPYSALKSL